MKQSSITSTFLKVKKGENREIDISTNCDK